MNSSANLKYYACNRAIPIISIGLAGTACHAESVYTLGRMKEAVGDQKLNKGDSGKELREPNDVDTFVSKLKAGEIIINPKAREIHPRAGKDNIAFGLADSITEYENAMKKDIDSDSYRECKSWINQALTHNLVGTGQSIIRLLETRDSKIAALEQKIMDLEGKYSLLEETRGKQTSELIAVKAKYEECKDNYEKLVNSFSGLGSMPP